MKRRHFLASLAGLSACARDPRPRLNVYNWSAYIAPETIPNFEREFGVRVRYATYESNEEMLAKVFTGNSGWDVVFPTHSRIGPMRAHGLLVGKGGLYGNVIRLSPMLNIAKSDVDEAVQLLDKSFAELPL